MVNIGFIGVGGIGRHHMRLLEKIKDVKVIACCDKSQDSLKEVEKIIPLSSPFSKGGNKGISIYTDHHKMLDKEDLDGVYICLPPFAHTDQELACIQKNLPFFVEKPISLSIEYSTKVAKAAKKKNLITAVGYQRRYWDLAERAKQLVKERGVGFVWGYWIGGVPGPYWWKQKKLCGGQHIEQTTHIFDVLRYIVGEVDEVYAVAHKGMLKHIQGCDVEDASIATLKFKNGVIGEITSSCLISQGFKEGSTYFSKDFYFILDGNKLTTYEPDRVVEERGKTDPMLLEDIAFIEAIKKKDPKVIKCPYEEGLKTLILTIKADESLRLGKPVKVGSNS